MQYSLPRKYFSLSLHQRQGTFSCICQCADLTQRSCEYKQLLLSFFFSTPLHTLPTPNYQAQDSNPGPKSEEHHPLACQWSNNYIKQDLWLDANKIIKGQNIQQLNWKGFALHLKFLNARDHFRAFSIFYLHLKNRKGPSKHTCYREETVRC